MNQADTSSTVQESLVTIECGRPGARYALLDGGPAFDVHLAPVLERGGTGPCICGFDRHGAKVGFSVGGGFSGPSFQHEVCQDCTALADDRPIEGLHKGLFS